MFVFCCLFFPKKRSRFKATAERHLFLWWWGYCCRISYRAVMSRSPSSRRHQLNQLGNPMRPPSVIYENKVTGQNFCVYKASPSWMLNACLTLTPYHGKKACFIQATFKLLLFALHFFPWLFKRAESISDHASAVSQSASQPESSAGLVKLLPLLQQLASSACVADAAAAATAAVILYNYSQLFPRSLPN